MHSSSFSYPISKPYPFRWFTPVVIICAIFFTAFFSIINFAANGYFLKPIYTSDPNRTLGQPSRWYMKPPFSWGDLMSPSCEPRSLSIGDRFYTANSGLHYDVIRPYHYNEALKREKAQPSVQYLNNPLRKCQTAAINIVLNKVDESIPSKVNNKGDNKTTFSGPAWWNWQGYATAWVSCDILDSNLGSIYFETKLELFDAISGRLYYPFLIDMWDYTERASIWWGSRLLMAYWFGILSAIAKTVPANTASWKKAAFFFLPNSTSTTARNIKDLNFFGLDGYFITTEGNVEYIQTIDGSYANSAYNNPKYPPSIPLTEAQMFAKLVHSLIMVDLGATEQPNLLLDEALLSYALDPDNDDNRQKDGILNDPKDYWYNYYASLLSPESETSGSGNWTPLTEAYNQFKGITGPLRTQATTIHSDYVCLVPTRRDSGTLVLVIVLANLVFLQALWKILNGIAEIMVQKADPNAMVCIGCAKAGYEALPLKGLSRTTSHATDTESTKGLVTTTTYEVEPYEDMYSSVTGGQRNSQQDL